jgi:hypothetical protein
MKHVLGVNESSKSETKFFNINKNFDFLRNKLCFKFTSIHSLSILENEYQIEMMKMNQFSFYI